MFRLRHDKTQRLQILNFATLFFKMLHKSNFGYYSSLRFNFFRIFVSQFPNNFLNIEIEENTRNQRTLEGKPFRIQELDMQNLIHINYVPKRRYISTYMYHTYTSICIFLNIFALLIQRRKFAKKLASHRIKRESF